MSKYKILFTDTLLYNLSFEAEEFAKIDAEIKVASDIDEDTLIKEAADCDAVIVQSVQINKKIVEALDKCRIVVSTSVGYDHIDAASLTEKGIMFANIPDYCTPEVSDHTIALIMALSRKITAFNDQIKAGIWDESAARPMHRLSERTLGLYGFGNIAKMVASKAKAIGFNVVAFDPFVSERAMNSLGVGYAKTPEEMLEVSDFVSLHAPLNESTRNIINSGTISKMKKTAYLINTSRGGLVNMDDLYEALKNKKISGAAIDVVPVEPPDLTDPIYRLDNLIVTPHIAYYSEEAEMDLKIKAVNRVILALTEG